MIRKENGKYHLKIGEKYTLTRKIPKDYYKVITWKLQISNNDNPAIRTSRTGFTKRAANKNEKKQVINVLQLTLRQTVTHLLPGNWMKIHNLWECLLE